MSYFMRPARTTDAGKIGTILTEGNAAPPWKPKLHSGAQDIAFCGRMIDNGWVSVLEDEDGRVLGFFALENDEIHALYVAGPERSQGIGKLLVDELKSRCKRLELWCFQLNTGARRFYEREGFTEVQRTEGQGNDEGLPDIRFVWETPT